MQERLRILSQLQNLDMEIQSIEGAIATVPQAILSLKKGIEDKQRDISKAESELEVLEKERRKKERELDGRLEVLKKYKAQLHEVKTNKEYTALKLEIEGVKADNSLLEEEILALMEKGDELKRLREEKERKLKEEKEELKDEEEKRRKELIQLEEKFTQREAQRSQLVEGVEPALFARYGEVREVKGGIALVSVKNSACQGCFTELPPQTISELMKDEKIIACERCSRILYLEE